MERFRWGILGTGTAARQFALGLQHVPSAELVAVGSRTRSSAHAFGQQFGCKLAGSYAELVEFPSIDIIYIATLNHLHHEHLRLCLLAGRAVLCEKPFTMSGLQAADAIKLARSRKLFMMEGMWTRFLPAVQLAKRLVCDGEIGDVRTMIGQFGTRVDHRIERLFRAELGGGALFDRGVYLVSLSSMFLGTPRYVVSVAEMSVDGVDEQSAMLLSCDHGRVAVLACSICVDMPKEAIFVGSEGSIRVHSPLYRPEQISVFSRRLASRTVELPIYGNGFNYEAAEVQRCLAAGVLESAFMTLDETQSVMDTLDRIRAQWFECESFWSKQATSSAAPTHDDVDRFIGSR